MKILLIQPPVKDFYFTKKRSIPYGLITIATSLKQNGFDVELLDCLATKKVRSSELPPDSEYLSEFYGKADLSSVSLFHKFKHFGYSFDHIKEIIKKSDATLFGISSLFTAYSSVALKIAEIIKEIDQNHIVVIGGHHPTSLPKEVLKDNNVDFIIRGEGEEVFPELVKYIKAGSDYSSLKGVGFIKNGEYIINEPAELNETDSFPLPDLKLLNHKFYSRSNKGSTVIVSSRGCPMKCSYCCVSKSNSTYRRRSIESVMEEIRRAVELGAGFIDFEDENISLNRSWFMELLERLEEFSHLNIEYRAMNGLFPPTLKPEIIKSMKKAGFKTLNLSLGSISKKSLKLFGRPDIKENLICVIETASENLLETVTYIIAGAPEQDPFETIDDLIFLSELNTTIGVSTFYPAPGSEIFASLRASEKLPANFDHYRSSFIPVSDRSKRIETVTIQRIGRIINFMKFTAKKSIVEINESDDYIIKEFLKDGKIRGVDDEGKFYEHLISEKLTGYFLENFNPSKLKA